MTSATYGSISVTVVDYKAQSAVVKLSRIPIKNCTIKNAEKLADFVKKYCNARVSGYSATIGVQDDDTSTGKCDRVLQRLQVLFKDHKNNTNRSLGIPAPKDSALNDDQEPHSDIPEDVRDLLKTLGAISEKDELEYTGGGLTSRVGRAGSRSTKATGV